MLFFGVTQSTKADVAPGDVTFENLKWARDHGTIFISMDVDLKKLKLKKEEELVFTPVLYDKDLSYEFPEFRVTGRYRYYRHLRNESDTLDLKSVYRYKENDLVHYEASAPYEDWMETSRLVVLDNRCGCPCKVEDAPRSNDIGQLDFRDPMFVPDYFYINPEEKEVVRSASGAAFVDFVVNRTEIREDYRQNTRELNKIIATVDSIKADPDVQITSLTVKGYASPEGSYANNTRLAKERTVALKNYLKAKYTFPEDVMKVDYEPEDWEGFRSMLQQTNLAHKDAILAIIDDPNMKPDPKDHLIRSRYPEDYRYILTHIYPALRHSDYTVSYKVKSYTDIDEAKRVMKTRPGNLSEHEFFMVAQTYEPGSEEFNECFDIMVRIYPDQETANINAANVAMQRGDLQSARKFLARVGNSPEADYARGNLACLIENGKRSEDRNFDHAIRYFDTVKSSNNIELTHKAAEALLHINEMK